MLVCLGCYFGVPCHVEETKFRVECEDIVGEILGESLSLRKEPFSDAS